MALYGSLPIEYASVPQAVRTEAEKEFGTSSGLKAMKCQEYGETKYEIEGMKGGKKHEVSYDEKGKHED